MKGKYDTHIIFWIFKILITQAMLGSLLVERSLLFMNAILKMMMKDDEGRKLDYTI